MHPHVPAPADERLVAGGAAVALEDAAPARRAPVVVIHALPQERDERAAETSAS